MPPTQAQKYETFRRLHDGPGVFVIPNPWDAGTARILTALGFPALATTSAGAAFSAGCRDTAGDLTLDRVLSNAQGIVDATVLPVAADLQNGYAETPEGCARTIRRAAAIGLVGGSIEDADEDAAQPIFDLARATERVAAAAEAARDLPFVLTARAENFLYDRPDLDDTIRRLAAYADAGADVLYAPGLPDLESIRTVCRAIDKPVNVVMGLRPPFLTVAELAEAGARRISVGSLLARTAFDAFLSGARRIRDEGRFDCAADAVPSAEIDRLIQDGRGS